MKLQLDTENKIIKIEETVNLGELFETLERLLPNGEWKSFKLDVHTTINWTQNPITFPYIPYEPIKPWYEQPWITYYTANTDGANYTLKSGVFNIET